MDTLTLSFSSCRSGPGTASWEVWTGCKGHCKSLTAQCCYLLMLHPRFLQNQILPVIVWIIHRIISHMCFLLATDISCVCVFVLCVNLTRVVALGMRAWVACCKACRASVFGLPAEQVFLLKAGQRCAHTQAPLLLLICITAADWSERGELGGALEKAPDAEKA